MRSRRFCFFICFFAVLLSFLFSSCENPYLQEERPLPTLNIPEASPAPTDGNGAESISGNLVLGIYEYDTLNPLMTENEALRRYLTLVYESLAVPGKDGAPTPQLARDWSTTDGGVTWKITIRENVTYHDGSVCTVYDVKNTLEWIAGHGGAYADCAEGISDFNILDRKSVV